MAFVQPVTFGNNGQIQGGMGAPAQQQAPAAAPAPSAAQQAAPALDLSNLGTGIEGPQAGPYGAASGASDPGQSIYLDSGGAVPDIDDQQQPQDQGSMWQAPTRQPQGGISAQSDQSTALDNLARSPGVQGIQNGIAAAMGAVKAALQWGRVKHGLMDSAQAGQGDQQQSQAGGGAVMGLDDGGTVLRQNSGGQANSGFTMQSGAQMSSGGGDPTKGYKWNPNPNDEPDPEEGAKHIDKRNSPHLSYAGGGAVKSYDDGGAVDPDSDDNDGDNALETGAINTGADDGGQAQAPQAPQGQQAQAPAQGQAPQAQGSTFEKESQQIGAPAAGLRAAGRTVLQYLMGADAAPPQAVEAIEHAVDPQQQGDQSTKTLQTIQYAAQKGEDVGFGVTQNYRKKADAARSFAAAALDGGNIASAADAATKAAAFTPDGYRTVFQPGQNGVTATVTSLNNPNQTQQVQLTPEQFKTYLRSPKGMFDNLADKGAPAVLQELAQSGASSQSRAPNALVPPAVQAGQQPTRQGAQPDASQAQGSNWDKQLETRSREIYPFVGQNTARLEWLQKAQEKQEDQATARVRAGHDWQVDAARINAGARTQAAQTKSNGDVMKAIVYGEARKGVATTNAGALLATTMAKLASAERNGQRRDALNEAGRALAAGQDPDTVGTMLKKQGINIADYYQNQPQFTPQGGNNPLQQSAPQAPRGPQAPRAPDQILNGKTYRLNPATGKYAPVQ